jgi:GntP family gluconate:H+ symporter
LKATALSDFFEGMTNNPELPAMWLFPVSFLLAAGLKTSQGSSTAAMVIASSMIASLLPGAGMESPVQKALLVLCIGAGAMTVSHANDSYFWVISQYAQIPPRDMFRHFSLSTFWMGLSVLLSSMLLAVILG